MKGNMADYFTNFSLILRLTKEQQEYALNLVKEVEAYRNENQQLPINFPASLRDEVENWVFETELAKDGIWLHSQYGGQEVVCQFIQHLLQKYDFAPSLSFEWSHDCSQPRTDAFGGGAAFITAIEVKLFSTSEWLQNLSKELPAKPTKEHLFSPNTHLCVKCGIHADDDLVENSPCTH